MRVVRAGLLVSWVVSCGSKAGDAPTGESSGESSTSADTGTTGDDISPCVDDDDCMGNLACEDGTCIGCIVDEDCGGTLQCSDGYCLALEDLAVCEQSAGATCGNGSIEMLEECDGTAGCTECSSDVVPTPWIVAEGISRLVPTSDGGAIALTDEFTPRAIMAFDTDGSPRWSQPVTEQAFDLAVDPVGNGYLVGVGSGVPWIGAWDPTGEVRWAIEGDSDGGFLAAAADATRVVAGGIDGPSNGETRGLLRQFTTEGTQQWTIDEPSLEAIEGVALVDAEVAVTGRGPPPAMGSDAPKLLRFDDVGALRWSIDLPQDGEDDGYRPAHVAGDGDGGTWSFGAADGGPWAVRHDREGQELVSFECLGHATGWVERVAVGPQGQLALGIFAFEDPPSHGSSLAWFAVLEGDTIIRARRFGGQNIAAGTLALQWRDDGSLVLGWTDAFDVGTRSEVLVLPP